MNVKLVTWNMGFWSHKAYLEEAWKYLLEEIDADWGSPDLVDRELSKGLLCTVLLLVFFRAAIAQRRVKSATVVEHLDVVEEVTDEQLETVKMATGWQRMDSTQVLSNLAEMKRLGLLVTVLQSVHKQLPEPMKDEWAQRWARYLEGRPH